MEIPWQNLQPDTLESLIGEFISREGTDYGMIEVSFETKMSRILELLEDRKIALFFDPETESSTFRDITLGLF